MLGLAGQRWGFLTREVGGVRYMLAKDLAQRLYGTSSTASLYKLLDRYGEKLVSIQTFFHDGKMLLRAAFGLHPKDGKTTFAAWRHFPHSTGFSGNTPISSRLS